MERVTLRDKDLIARQIGRIPRGTYSIARRCIHGFPAVLQVSPVMDGGLFPTLYWISCPFLRRAIGEIEAQGWVKRFEQRLALEEGLRESLDRAHEEYARTRLDSLTQEESRELEARDRLQELGRKGIGGIGDRSHLKCLHLHAAHALVGKNPVGDLVLEMLGQTACEAEKTICSSLAEGRSRSEINR